MSQLDQSGFWGDLLEWLGDRTEAQKEDSTGINIDFGKPSIARIESFRSGSEPASIAGR